MMKNSSCWVRCAAFLYVRLGLGGDRYWEFLGDSLLDDEEFSPFKSKTGDAGPTITVGEYVEDLLMKPDYGEGDLKFSLPRTPLAVRQKLAKRICLYPQMRKRYDMNITTDNFVQAG